MTDNCSLKDTRRGGVGSDKTVITHVLFTGVYYLGSIARANFFFLLYLSLNYLLICFCVKKVFYLSFDTSAECFTL